jgi:hypothetical protein
MKKFVLFVFGVMVACGLSAPAYGAAIVIVPGTSDPWLAGMPAGSTASSGDLAPGQSPVQVLGLAFTPGDLLIFTSTGTTDHCTGGGCGLASAEGDFIESPTGHSAGAQNGLANVVAPIDALIGVFLDASQPSLSPAPGQLLFGDPGSRNFGSLAPGLKQPFFIGDGRMNDFVTLQTFLVPSGATRLFLGTMDGFEWANNVGALTVTVDLAPTAVPEPATLCLFGMGLTAGIARARRRVVKN